MQMCMCVPLSQAWDAWQQQETPCHKRLKPPPQRLFWSYTYRTSCLSSTLRSVLLMAQHDTLVHTLLQGEVSQFKCGLLLRPESRRVWGWHQSKLLGASFYSFSELLSWPDPAGHWLGRLHSYWLLGTGSSYHEPSRGATHSGLRDAQGP